jgi:hypothetical protein
MDAAKMLGIFMEALKGIVYAIGVIAFFAMWLVPDPLGKIVMLWRFFRGDRLDGE